MSFKNSISKHWLTPFTISSAILASYYFAKFHFQTIFRLTLSLYIIWGIYYLCVNVFLQRYFDEDFFAYHLIQKAGQQFKDNTIVTTDWETAAKLSFWLEGKRHIYTLPCGKENQYAKWREGFNKATNVLYLDLHPRFACVQKHFSNCVYLASFTKDGHRLGFNDHTPPLKLVAYRCHYKKDL
jgi:hypothetical protein